MSLVNTHAAQMSVNNEGVLLHPHIGGVGGWEMWIPAGPCCCEAEGRGNGRGEASPAPEQGIWPHRAVQTGLLGQWGAGPRVPEG